MRYKWVWFHGANREVSVLRWGPSSSQQVFQRARLCQTSRSRVHSLPETRAVWLSSCYWLLFLWRAGFCQVNFFFFPSSASCQNTDCTELHTQALKAQPVLATPNSHLSSRGKRAVFDKQVKACAKAGCKTNKWDKNAKWGRKERRNETYNKILTGHWRFWETFPSSWRSWNCTTTGSAHILGCRWDNLKLFYLSLL